MGHNLVNVGEEYDGGSVYEGVNASPSLEQIKWRKWLTNPPLPGKPVVEEEAALLVQDYSWYELITFTWLSLGYYL